MTDKRSPKFIGAKLGLASALALGALPMVSTEALAAAAVSDTLQVGSNGTAQLIEGSETNSISQNVTPFSEGTQNITGTRIIALTDSAGISDLVTVTINCFEGCSPTNHLFELTVELQSDPETSLTTGLTIDESIPETGDVQHLSPDFTRLFNLTNPLPVIDVSSDVEAVPEPASLALFGSALAG